MSDLEKQIFEIGRKAREDTRKLSRSSTQQRNQLLETIADRLEQTREAIQEVNQKDLVAAKEASLSTAMIDRLTLTDARMDSMIQGVRHVTELSDPVGEVMKDWETEDGLQLKKVRVPIGVIGIIYESRPNVTVDAGALCLKTGNGVILRGGREAFYSNQELVKIMQVAARECGFGEGIVSFIPVTDREAVPLFCSMDQYIDLMIPRGGHGLIKSVVEHARMPVIKHYNGICHLYVHGKADFAMARKLIVNAKCQRPGVCNALETLLVDESIAAEFLSPCLMALENEGVKILANEDVSAHTGKTYESPVDWEQEYLDTILAVRVVKDIDEAMDHIEHHGSHHTETIVTEDKEAADYFLQNLDSASVFWNVSTRFSDGSKFGFGAEIGISTDKIHARGPMALEELTSYKYIGQGDGLVRSS